MRALSGLELRVLGVLVEKQHTVADSYPLSSNALLMGCNQKTARHPVMSASEADLLAATDALRGLGLVIESSTSRVLRYEHNLARVLRVPSQSVALLASLMLRGPQTAAELRANTDRLHRFADVSSVEGFLDELAARADGHGGPLVVKLARAPGSREARWAHLLGGPVGHAVAVDDAAPRAEAKSAVAAGSVGSAVNERANERVDETVHQTVDEQLGETVTGLLAEIAKLQANQQRLEAEVVLLRAQLQRMALGLGVDLQ